MKRVGEDTYVDLAVTKRMLNYFDKLLESVDELQENDPWPKTIQVTWNTSALCDFRSCMLKLVEMFERDERMTNNLQENLNQDPIMNFEPPEKCKFCEYYYNFRCRSEKCVKEEN